MKNILFITTGGTIAAVEGKKGLEPVFSAKELLAQVPQIKDLCNIKGKAIMSIDSTNMTPQRIKKIAETIYSHYDNFDGFIVTHGTDTMGYSSALLTYMLPHIKKPVVFTGAQVAIEQPYTDAKKNISDAVRFALEGIPGIFVAFDGKIIPGTRAIKIRSKSMSAFEAVNSSPIASLKLGRITYQNGKENIKNKYDVMDIDPDTPLELKTNTCSKISVIKLFPGIKSNIFNFVKENYQGIIIPSFGVGGIPNIKNYNITKKLKEVMEAGVATVVTTQCWEEGIDLDVYEVGRELSRNKKTIKIGDMNTETAVGKLMWALGNFEKIAEVKSFMETPMFKDMSKEEN